MNKNHLRIIELLIGGEKTVQEISYQLNISERTLSNYITQINDHFEQSIEIVKRHGRYSLIILDEVHFRVLLQKLRHEMKIVEYEQKQRRAEVFHILINNNTTTIDDIAESAHLSKSVINIIINDLKEMSISYSIDIKGTPNVGLRVNGTEFNIRKMLVNQFHDFYSAFQISDEMRRMIDNIKTLYHLDEESLNRLESAVKVTIERLEGNYEIKDKLNVDPKIYVSEDYMNFKELIDYIDTEYNVHNKNEEVLLIVMQLLGRRASIIDDIISNDDESLLKIIIQNTIDDIKDDFKIQIDESLFTKDIQLHIKYLINRLLFGIKLNNESLKDVQQKFPLAFELSKVLAQNIEQLIKISVPVNELGFLSIYFSIFLEELNEKLRNIKRIAIITDQGLSTSKMIESNLKNILNQNISVDIFTREEINEDILMACDLVISTIKVNRLFNKLIFVDDVLDKKLLRLKIEQFLVYKKVSRDTLINHNVLLDFIDESDLIHIDKSISYRDAIEMLSQLLISERKVDEGFTYRILERESNVSTISNSIGFPHAVHNFQDVQIKMAVLDEGLENNSEVKMIIMMAIPDSYSNEAMLIKLYEEVLSLSTNIFALSNINYKTNYSELSYLLNYRRGG
ncbi:BglG family transcription antiterminator [Corticicoccus populi]|uniref:BglG family transcription antiterminator n=1 Tax=Corticicoccus populi TaxID=1812821 RepID=A0ABW5WQT3_9STAP